MCDVSGCTTSFCFLTAVPEDRRDFSPDVVPVIFEADESGSQKNDILVPVRVFDDIFDEADEEVFIIVLTVDNSSLVADTNTARLQRQTSLCIIQDNDGKSSSVIVSL